LPALGVGYERTGCGLGWAFDHQALSSDAVAPLVAATTCYKLGADDLTVQRILRHGSVQVTREKYIKLKHGKMDAAMDSLTRAWDGQNQVGPRSGPESPALGTEVVDVTNTEARVIR
jgi:hypothetical protein